MVVPSFRGFSQLLQGAAVALDQKRRKRELQEMRDESVYQKFTKQDFQSWIWVFGLFQAEVLVKGDWPFPSLLQEGVSKFNLKPKRLGPQGMSGQLH